MRFIAVVGVLLVLASCSDSDMNDNNKFSLSCYDEKFRGIYEYHLVFDGRDVTRYNDPLGRIGDNASVYNYRVIKKGTDHPQQSPLFVIFEGEELEFQSLGFDGSPISYITKTMRYRLNKDTLIIKQKTLKVLDEKGNEIKDYIPNPSDDLYHQCSLPKIQ